MRTVCEKDMCAGCMACVDACAHRAIAIEDSIGAYNAVIDEDRCVGCGLCERVCQQLNPAQLRKPFAWRQGWAEDANQRAASSSGGAAAAISMVFVANGGVVCSCVFRDGRFDFDIVETPADVKKFKGSKYVKSDPAGAYRTVSALLRSGREVLFIGLPCQVSAMRNFCKDDEKLYTVDLICHGTPSPRLLDAYLHEHGTSLSEMAGIRFRRKGRFAVEGGSEPVEAPGVTDRYSIAFLNGLDYTENCYSCAYARTERVSDLTLGDSWGSELTEQASLGISLVLCQTGKGERLLEWAGMELQEVDKERAISNNGQLSYPMQKPFARKSFLEAVKSTGSFGSAVAKALPKECLKQDLKRVLIQLHLWKPSGSMRSE